MAMKGFKGKVHKTVIVTNIMKAIPIGTRVRMVNCLEAENPKNMHDWVTASEPWQIASGEWLVSLKGKSGGFCLENLELVEEANNGTGA